MKKFISLSLAIMMIVSVLTAGCFTSVSASTTEVCEWEHWDATNKRMYTAKKDDGSFSGKYFYKTTSATGELNYYSDGNGISSSPVLDVDSNWFVCYYRSNFNMGTKNVANFGFKAYIPNADKLADRYLYVSLANKGDGTAYDNNEYGELYFRLTDSKYGNAYGGADTTTDTNNVKVVSQSSSSVSGDTWHEFNIRIFLNENDKITYGMYLDGKLLVVCESTSTNIDFTDISINRILFKNSGTTYVKDISLTFEDYDAIYEPDSSAVALSDVLFNSFSLNDSTTKDMSVPGYGVASKVFQPAGSGTSSYYCTDSSKRIFANVDYALQDEALTDGVFVDNALKLTLTPSNSAATTYSMLQYFQKDVTSYFTSGSTKYMQMSYDVYIPEGTKDTTRRQVWQLGNNTGSKGSHCYAIASAIRNNKVWFYNDSTYTGDPLTKKTYTLDISPDKWYRIIYLLKIENSSDAEYTIHTEGYVLDIAADTTYKIYEVDETVPMLTAGTPGLTLCAQRMYAETPKVTDGSTVVTYYDNIISRISATNFSDYYMNKVDKLPSNYAFDIDFTLSGTTATARGRDADGNGAQKILIAGFDGSGRMVDCAVSNATNSDIDTEKGIVEFSWNFSSYSNIAEVKAFMFDGMTNCIPLANSVTLKVE